MLPRTFAIAEIEESDSELMVKHGDLFGRRLVFGLCELGGAVRSRARCVELATHHLGLHDEAETPELIVKIPAAFDSIGELGDDGFKHGVAYGGRERVQKGEEARENGEAIRRLEERVQ